MVKKKRVAVWSKVSFEVSIDVITTRIRKLAHREPLGGKQTISDHADADPFEEGHLIHTYSRPSKMKREAIALGSAVVVASLVGICIVPSASAAEIVDIADPKPAQADSTNDFSVTTTSTSGTTSSSTNGVGLNGGYNNDAADMREDEEYWDRLLQTMESSMPNAAAPASDDPSTEIRENDECPSRVVDVQCPGCQPIGEGCLLEVDMTHTIVNSGEAVVRIYELNAIRNNEKINLYDLVSSDAIDMQPGSQTQVVERVQINQCEGETFETETQLIAGPPADVVVTISCQEEGGGDCQSIAQPKTTDECREEVVYTYSLVNAGAVDANIITLERTRNDESIDLLSFLDGTSLAPGVTTSVGEMDLIDVCSGDTYSTQLLVQQVPNDDLLCGSTANYNGQNR